MLWKITPLLATSLSLPTSPISSILTPTSQILELGSGISALLGLTLAPLVARYVLTDQPYVSRFVEANIAANLDEAFGPSLASRTGKGPGRRKKDPANDDGRGGLNEKLVFRPLDWETDVPTAASLLPPTSTSSSQPTSFDVVLACDCIYNEALIAPLVETCAAACALRSSEVGGRGKDGVQSTVCLVAQQLRSPDIFEAWLRCFTGRFEVWRVPDAMLDEGLREGTGFVVHLGVLKGVGGDVMRRR